MTRRHPFGVAAMAGLLALGPATGWAQAAQAPERIDVDVLKQQLDAGETILLIDVREDDEVVSGSIPGSIHIPLGQLEARMQDIPKNVQLVFF